MSARCQKQLMARLLLSLSCASILFDMPAALSEPQISWRPWSEDIFKEAAREHKFVLLDLEAVWCHWCHVMDQKTYANASVQNLINQKFIAVRVDQDSRPDLSSRYGDYGWPATVFFTPTGKEAQIHQGYIQPQEMIAILNTVSKHPEVQKPLIVAPSHFSKGSTLSESLRKDLLGRYAEGYDNEHGSWSFAQKFLDNDSLEYAMARSMTGSTENSRRAQQTLDGLLNLIDPIWGGAYQYSTDSDWDHPHFEKIMSLQSDNLHVYSIGSLLYNQPKYLHAAQDVQRFLHDFLLSPQGAFYTSQDADLVKGQHSAEYFALNDQGRRKLGVPAVDKHIYARENGWAICGLCDLFMATGDEQYLNQAISAANWISKYRALPNGGFSHDEKDSSGPFLGDNLAMGRAFLSLYTCTADSAWLVKAKKSADFIAANFSYEPSPNVAVGYKTAAKSGALQDLPLQDENVVVARFANLLFRYTGDKKYKSITDQAMKLLSTVDIAKKRKYLVGGILLADFEVSQEPTHLVVVGAKGDRVAKELFTACLKFPSAYKRIEWYDPASGPLPNSDVEYPKLDKPAAFVCSGDSCSAPLFTLDAIQKRIDGLVRR